MYKVLIVDDDKVIRQDLKAILDWQRYGFKVTAEASTGQEALEQMKKNAFDLVITDIYMPVMDGIELIKRAKNEYPSAEFIVVSNYDEFRYVKTAMKYGALDYVLKYEIDANSFIPIIASVRNKLEGKQENSSDVDRMNEDWRYALEEKFWRNLLTDQKDLDTIRAEGRRLGIDIASGPHVLFFIDISFGQLDEAYINSKTKELNKNLNRLVRECAENYKYSFVLRVEDCMWVIILKSGEKSQSAIKNSGFLFSRGLMKRIKDGFDANIVCEIGDVILKAEEFPVAYKRMRECIESKFYYGLDVVIDMSYFNDMKFSYDEKVMESLKKGILDNVVRMDFKKAEKELVSAVEIINSQKLSPGLVYEFFTLLLLSIKEIMEGKGVFQAGSNGISLGKKIRSFKTLKSIEQYTIQILQTADCITRNDEGVCYRPEVQKAVCLIRENYMKTLTLDSVSESVGVSKNYLCRIFKEETGVNFIDYLNMVRVDKAKHIITNTDKSIKEVAYLVGMDYAYFCKVFRSSTGKRPSDLR